MDFAAEGVVQSHTDDEYNYLSVLYQVIQKTLLAQVAGTTALHVRAADVAQVTERLHHGSVFDNKT